MDEESPGRLPYGAVAYYTCSEGFILTGKSELTCIGDGTRSTGHLNGDPPLCQGDVYPERRFKTLYFCTSTAIIVVLILIISTYACKVRAFRLGITWGGL